MIPNPSPILICQSGQPITNDLAYLYKNIYIYFRRNTPYLRGFTVWHIERFVKIAECQPSSLPVKEGKGRGKYILITWVVGMEKQCRSCCGVRGLEGWSWVSGLQGGH